MTFYFIIAFLLFVFVVLYDRLSDKSERIAYTIVVFLLMILAAFRGEDVDRDYFIYKGHFEEIPLLIPLLKGAFYSYVEPTYVLLVSFLKTIGLPFSVLIFLYALLGVYLKTKAIKMLVSSELLMLSLFVYFCHYFLLHEMTQIRIGVACGFLMLSIPSIYERNFKRYLCYFIPALLFHYSTIVFFPVYFLNGKKIDKMGYLLLIALPVVLVTTGFDPISILSNYDLGIYSEKIRVYKELQSWQKSTLNIWNMPILFQLIMSMFFLYNIEFLTIKNKYMILLLKINIFAIALFYLFCGLNAFALRLSELMGVVQIVLIPHLIYFGKERYIPQLIILSLALLMLVHYATVELMDGYHFIFLG